MSIDYGAARENMVANQVRTNDVTDLGIQDAMRVLPRERFCPPGREFLAYAEVELEYAPGWRLMAPRELSKLLQALEPKRGETALSICGPYAAAVLARMGLETSLRSAEGEPAAAAAKALDGASVKISKGDPKSLGKGTYDVLICEGALETAPPKAWLDAVAIGGRLGVVQRKGPVGKAVIYVRGDDGQVAAREVFDAATPVLPGFEAAPAFAF